MAQVENVSLNLMKWDSAEEPLAPLTSCHREILAALEEEITSLDVVSQKAPEESKESESGAEKHEESIETCQQLLKHYAALEEKYARSTDTKYVAYLKELKERRAECDELRRNIEQALGDFSSLSKQYSLVSGKTSSLHDATEQLIADQANLNNFVDKVAKYVGYFREVDFIMEKLESHALSPNSQAFEVLLNKIDANIEFMQKHPSFRESATYLVKYKHCRSRATSLMQNYIFDLLDRATDSIMNSNEEATQDKSSHASLALFYGRFQTTLPKARPVIEQIERRCHKSPEYESLLNECHCRYLNRRGAVMEPSVAKALEAITDRYNGDRCTLVRDVCALLLNVSLDEHRLFYQFFTKNCPFVATFLEGLCTSLYDTLRPSIVYLNHLETLAEICCILRIEMLEEHVQNNLEPLQGFGNVCMQLLYDARERLVSRAYVYLQTDVLNYNPSPGDLAYPEKLKMMEDIAESIREENRQMRMKKISVSSIERENYSTTTAGNHHLGMETPLGHKSLSSNVIGNSPADLHGMWYPTVRRTLVCLSRLYRCVDRPVFQSLSREAIQCCVASIESAKEKIESRSSLLDAELFQIKHLLILREQIAPFQVDFTVKEYSLDFSKFKTAAMGLLEKRSRLFAFPNNALVEFLFKSAPQMKEQLIDSRKHVDAQLKSSCERFIQHSSFILIEPVMKLLEKAKKSVSIDDQNTMRQLPFGDAQEIAAVVADSLRLIKFKLPNIQQSLQLYLANRETKSILFRPIKNNVVAAFTHLSQLLSNNYSPEELLLIACPLPEQISIMLSSSSLAKTSSSNQSSSSNERERKESVVSNASSSIFGDSTKCQLESSDQTVSIADQTTNDFQADKTKINENDLESLRENV